MLSWKWRRTCITQFIQSNICCPFPSNRILVSFISSHSSLITMHVHILHIRVQDTRIIFPHDSRASHRRHFSIENNMEKCAEISHFCWILLLRFYGIGVYIVLVCLAIVECSRKEKNSRSPTNSYAIFVQFLFLVLSFFLSLFVPLTHPLWLYHPFSLV